MTLLRTWTATGGRLRLNLPFDLSHRIPIAEAKADPFFQEVYYGGPRRATKTISGPGARSRPTGWASPSDLALRLDNDTNNTSLALAIELSPGGDVLLFPGDAQVGNWLSWAELAWPHGAKPEDRAAVTAERLLAPHRAVQGRPPREPQRDLARPGAGADDQPAARRHHSGRRARRRNPAPGSKTFGKGWKMPYGDLYLDLKKRTKDRIVRGDGDPAQEQRAFAEGPTNAHRPVQVSHEPTGLWVELTFPLSNKGAA